MAFAAGISVERVVDKLPKEFFVGGGMGGVALRTVAIFHRILRMSFNAFGIFGIVTLLTQFFRRLKKLVRGIGRMRTMTLEAILRCWLVNLCPLERLFFMAGETE